MKVAVTVTKAIANARGKTEFDRLEKGQRFVGVQIVLKNVGSVAYDDAPGNGARLIDTRDQQYDTDLREISAGPTLSGGVKLAPGSTRKGYLVFAIPLGRPVLLAREPIGLGRGISLLDLV